jgi:hypothetical protein
LELSGSNDNVEAIKSTWATVNKIREQAISVYPFGLLRILEGYIPSSPSNTI